MLGRVKSLKFSTLSFFGIALILLSLFSFIPNLAAYALIASIIGEDKLESAGNLTTVGAFVFWLPVLLGICLLIVGIVFKPTLANIWKIITGVGLLMGALGVWSVLMPSPTETGANIGAGILILTSIVVTAIGIATGIAKKLATTSMK